MSDNVRRDNRRALPKYLLTILLFGLLGGVLGFFTGVAGAAGVAETVRQALDRVLAVCAPWGIVGSAVVLLGAGWYLYAAAKRRFAAWDGEDEDAMDAAEQQLSWALLLTGLVIILDFFFFAASIIYGRFLPDLILFLASVAVLVVLQQKIVDLERRINPEKRGSVYDMKFQKTWMDSCDEAERAQIGQACYRAYMVGTKVCIFLWVALLILNCLTSVCGPSRRCWRCGARCKLSMPLSASDSARERGTRNGHRAAGRRFGSLRALPVGEKEGANLMPPGISQSRPACQRAGFVVFFILFEGICGPSRGGPLPDARIWRRCLWSNCC